MLTNKEAIEILQMYKDVIRQRIDKANAPEVKDVYQWQMDGFDMAINALKQTAWIPVRERLPEVGERVLVTKRVTRFRNETHIARYNVTRWCSFGTISNKNIVAWMPLPEAYKGGDNND